MLVPVAAGGRLEPRTNTLLNNACNNIFEILNQLGELLDASVNYLLCPGVDFAALINKIGNNILDNFGNNSFGLLRVEVHVIVVVVVGHYSKFKLIMEAEGSNALAQQNNSVLNNFDFTAIEELDPSLCNIN